MDCVFCKIVESKIKSEIIYRDDHSLALLDLNPHTPGHTLVIPTVHTKNILELPPEEIAPLFLTVRRITAILQESLKPESITIGINHNEERGVPHLHIHLMPRYRSDGGKVIQSLVESPSLTPVNEMAKLLIAAQKK